ncbi:hypothetical protein ANN_22291 [Periplaneta americana]|uniref:Uncharacterized protein n=1 Tax=Periplaneta americana TaxID=6978 RepID=A0ABQ8S815_PERAM|nr:hypothetical protein ANN_22291 [Periplaneta americana]
MVGLCEGANEPMGSLKARLIDWTLQLVHILLSTDVHIRTDHVRYTLRYLHCFSVVSCLHTSDSTLNGILFIASSNEIRTTVAMCNRSIRVRIRGVYKNGYRLSIAMFTSPVRHYGMKYSAMILSRILVGLAWNENTQDLLALKN